MTINRADLWLSNTTPLANWGNTESRGMDSARRIDSRASVILISRRMPNGDVIQLPPQTVFIEIIENPRGDSEVRDAIVSVSRQYVEVVGNKDNPFLPDTDIQRGDTFLFKGLQFEIMEMIPTIPGRLLASGAVTP